MQGTHVGEVLALVGLGERRDHADECHHASAEGVRRLALEVAREGDLEGDDAGSLEEQGTGRQLEPPGAAKEQRRGTGPNECERTGDQELPPRAYDDE